jgi:hypothetical protein
MIVTTRFHLWIITVRFTVGRLRGGRTYRRPRMWPSWTQARWEAVIARIPEVGYPGAVAHNVRIRY